MTKVIIKFPSPVKCDFCRYSFNNSRALDQHMTSEHEMFNEPKVKEPILDCTECGVTFKSREEQNHHNEECHEVSKDSNIKFICSDCDIKFVSSIILNNHIASGHLEVAGSIIDDSDIIKIETYTNHTKDNGHIPKTEYYKIEHTGGKKEKDPRPGMEAFENDNTNDEPTGITMKGKGLQFQDACIALKQLMVKGRTFKDNNGRILTILDAPRGTAPIDVEVTTLSKKPSEKRGKAKLIIHKPNMKRDATLHAGLYSGSNFVFVKELMEMFVKPFIDSLISDESEDPMNQYRVKSEENNSDNKTIPIKEEKCNDCDKTFPTSRGLSIHVGRVHKNNDPTVKRKRKEDVSEVEKEVKRIKLKELVDGIIECDECGLKFRYMKSYEWHMKKCIAQINKSCTSPIKPTKVHKSCHNCDISVEAQDFTTLLESIQIHNSLCKEKRDNKLPQVKSVSENEVEQVVKGVEDLHVAENICKIAKSKLHCCIECSFSTTDLTQLKNHMRCDNDLNPEDKVPERLREMLSIKGIDINDHRLRRAGGGGTCGAKCVSLFTTGSEMMAVEIRDNVNNHIVSN